MLALSTPCTTCLLVTTKPSLLTIKPVPPPKLVRISTMLRSAFSTMSGRVRPDDKGCPNSVLTAEKVTGFLGSRSSGVRMLVGVLEILAPTYYQHGYGNEARGKRSD